MHEVHQCASHASAFAFSDMHERNQLYTSTACWRRLSTAWPLHPTRRRGLLRQSAPLTAVQTTEAKRHPHHTNSQNHVHNKLPNKNLATVANARLKGCLWQPNSKWTEHDRTSSKPESSFAAEVCGNPGDGGNPVEDSAVTFTEKKTEPTIC